MDEGELDARLNNIAEALQSANDQISSFYVWIQKGKEELDDFKQLVESGSEGLISINTALTDQAASLAEETLTAVGDAVEQYETHCAEISTMLDDRLQAMTASLIDAREQIEDLFEGLVSQLGGLGESLEEVGGDLASYGAAAEEALAETIETVEDIAGQLVEVFCEEMKEFFGEQTQMLKEALVDALESRLEWVRREFLDRIIEITREQLLKPIQEHLQALTNEISEAAAQYLEEIESMVTAVFAEIREKVFSDGDASKLQRQALEPVIDQLKALIVPLEATIGAVDSLKHTVGLN